MTYCLGIKVDEGLVFASDSRTNAGLDDFSIHTKMFTYGVGDRAIVILTSGNLSTSQAVFHSLNTDLNSAFPEKSLNTCVDMEDVAAYVGSLSVKISKNYDQSNLSTVNFSSYFIVGGQIKNQEQKIFLVYPEGNYIGSSENNPFFQLGETKYGKPILDRVLTTEISLESAAKCILLSMDSTLRSNISVGLPLDLFIFDKKNPESFKYKFIDEKNSFFIKLKESWSQHLKKGFSKIDSFDWNQQDLPIKNIINEKL